MKPEATVRISPHAPTTFLLLAFSPDPLQAVGAQAGAGGVEGPFGVISKRLAGVLTGKAGSPLLISACEASKELLAKGGR